MKLVIAFVKLNQKTKKSYKMNPFRLQFILLFLFFNCFLGNSQNVSLTEAKYIGTEFLSFKDTLLKMPMELQLADLRTSSTNEKLWYVLTSENSYIIISANKKSFPILAYSFTDSYPLNDALPPALAEWLDMRAIEMEYLIENKTSPTSEITEKWDNLLKGQDVFFRNKSFGVEPLLLSRWDQNCFYNEQCPADPAGPCGKTYAGCVATAIAQIMYYYRYPKTGLGSNSYEHHIYGILSANFGATEYKWNEMRSHIATSAPALAELLYHVGVAVQMDYSSQGSGSSTETISIALKQYFKYSNSVNHKYRHYFNNTTWKYMLKNDLNNGYPLVYAGRKTLFEPGHAFVCDGYDDNDFFHFDWGWNGQFNGYFYIDNLNPGGYDFNWGQSAVFNIVPQSIQTDYCSGKKTLTSVVGSFDDGSGVFSNYAPQSFCSWLIYPETPVDYIVLDFVKFEISDENDVITVYDGSNSSAPIIGVYSGTEIPTQIQSSGQSLFVTFTSNSTMQSKGWLAEYYSVPTKFCNLTQVVSDLSGTITDGSGNFDYSNNTICRWNIIPSSGEKIFIEFNEFNTEPIHDVLKIIDLNTNTIIAEYSGNGIPPSQIINSSKIRIQFITNESITDKGWSLSYSVTTSMNELDLKNRFNIYPNPSNGKVYIQFQENPTDDVLVQINDLTSKLQYVHLFNTTEAPMLIDVSTLPKGVYILSLTIHDTIYREKIVLH
jgi:hypothetical protein